MSTADEATGASSAPRLRIAALLFALACAVYLGSLRNGLVFDDALIVTGNPAVTGEAGMLRIFTSGYWVPTEANPLLHPHLYRPVTILSFRLQHQLCGTAPWSWHLVNVLLHGAVTSTLLFILLRLSGSLPAATAGALLFAVHPVHSEAVVSVVGRAELLAGLFVLAAWLLRDRLFVSALLFVLGMLSKENAVVLPGLLVLEDVASAGWRPWSRERLRKRLPLPGLMLLVVVALLCVRAKVLGVMLGDPGGPFSRTPAAHRLLTAVEILGRDLWLMVFPAHLSADYGFDQIPVVTSPWHPGFAAGLAATAACALLAWLARRRLPALSLGIVFFFVALAPVSNLLFGIGTPMAERLLYLPSAGLCLAAGALLEHAAKRIALPSSRTLAATCLLAAIPALPFAVRCWTRTADWRNPRTFFLTTVRTSPRSTLAWLGLGNVHEADGRLAEAEMAYRKSMEIAPGRAVGHFNLGNVLEKLGRPLEAIRELELARELQPGLWQACAPLGQLYLTQGNPRKAEEAWRCAVEEGPPRAPAHAGLAAALAAMGRTGEAIAQCEEALRLDPGDPRVARMLEALRGR